MKSPGLIPLVVKTVRYAASFHDLQEAPRDLYAVHAYPCAAGYSVSFAFEIAAAAGVDVSANGGGGGSRTAAAM